MINWRIKKFAELSGQELYDILALRSAVFVVEQNCIYQDIDQKDKVAFHLLGYNEHLVAYARLFGPGDYFKEASIGRVVVRKDYRGRQLGHELMQNGINYLYQYREGAIVISAQQYLVGFYEQHGFQCEGEPYLEDGIPHVKMRLD